MTVRWVCCFAAIVAIGILSRIVSTGFVVFDKYLGDALYAAMVYVILRLFAAPAPAALYASLAMTAIELFQLTLIPARMLASEHWITRICARLLGTQFSCIDLLAYAVGIACIYFADFVQGAGRRANPGSA